MTTVAYREAPRRHGRLGDLGRSRRVDVGSQPRLGDDVEMPPVVRFVKMPLKAIRAFDPPLNLTKDLPGASVRRHAP